MNHVIDTTVVYLLLLLVMRAAGRRTMAQLSTFDLILVLVISEAVQGALLANDTSITGAFLVVGTLVGLDIMFALVKQHWPRLDKWIDGVPVVLVHNGRTINDLLHQSRVDVNDILHAARQVHGLHNLEEIEFAILEASGEISIIPRKD